MNNNDDLVNDILKELKTSTPGGEDMPPEGEAPEAAAYTPEDAAFIPEEAFPEAAPEGENVPDEPYPADNGAMRQTAEAPVRTAPARRRKKKKKKKQRNRLPGVLILTTLIIAVSIVLSLVIITCGKDVLGIGKDDTPHAVTVQDGATIDDIAYMLEEKGIIRYPKIFILFSKLRKADSSYIPGQYYLRGNMAYETIIQKLTSKESENKVSVEVTFPEGITLDEIAAKLEENKVCKAEDFLFTFNSGNFGCKFEDELKGTDNSLKFRRMEGYAFPDTYMFYEDMDIDEVCMKIYYNFDSKMTNEHYAKMKQRGLTLDQLITFASIVQKESGNPESMNIIASVFWNRLKDPGEFAGKLQSDPTTNYAKFTIKPNLVISNKAMLDAYDTYVGEGLPPGAICNPGIQAIDAVLDAIDTDYRYFAANIYTGVTEYSVTYEEHLAKVERIHEEEAQYLAEHPEEQEGN